MSHLQARQCHHRQRVRPSLGLLLPPPAVQVRLKAARDKGDGSGGGGSSSAASESPAQVHGKFYWPNQTNAEARIPVEIKQVRPGAVTAAAACVEEGSAAIAARFFFAHEFWLCFCERAALLMG
jgi:hypothetical protein